MRKGLLSCLLVLLIPAALFSQVEFLEVVTGEDMDEARRKASDGMQMLFVDIYATWCGPCKQMDREVYPDPELSAYMNEHFINVRMDGETPFGRGYAGELNLQGYPSVFIFGTEGELVSSIVGYKPAGELLASLKSIKASYADLKRFRSMQQGGKMEKEDLASYIVLLRELGSEEEAGKMAGQYARMELGDELTGADLRVIVPYMDVGDELWPKVDADPVLLQESLGADYVEILQQVYNNSLKKAIDTGDLTLLSRMSHDLIPLIAVAMDAERDMKAMPFIHYYYYQRQTDELIKYIDDRWASDKKGDHEWLFGAAAQVIDMDQRQRTRILMEKGEDWLAECIALEPRFDYHFYHALSLVFQDKEEQARLSLNRAGELAETPEQTAMVDRIFQYIGR